MVLGIYSGTFPLRYATTISASVLFSCRPAAISGSIRSGRFSGIQLPKLLSHYDFTYLLVEGRYKTGPDGTLLVPYGDSWTPAMRGKTSNFTVLEMNSFLNTISLQTPVRVFMSPSREHTVEWVLSLVHSFSKPWDKHHAHTALHVPAPVATIGKASTVRRVAFALQGIGWERSGAVASNFHSVASMVGVSALDDDQRSALISSWRKVPGFGRTLSARVVQELLGEYDPGDPNEL